MYTMLGYDFHIKAMTEMLRVYKGIRIFPIVDLDANKTELISSVIGYFKQKNSMEAPQMPITTVMAAPQMSAIIRNILR